MMLRAIWECEGRMEYSHWYEGQRHAKSIATWGLPRSLNRGINRFKTGRCNSQPLFAQEYRAMGLAAAL